MYYFIRLSGLLLFFVLHPFWAYLINQVVFESLDCLVPNFFEYHIEKIKRIATCLTKREFSLCSNKCPDPEYQTTDKLLDSIFYTFSLIATTWIPKPFQKYLVFAYVYRVIGFFLFRYTGDRKYLFYFPNFFGMFYLFFYGMDFFSIELNERTQNIIMVLIILFKFISEYQHHYKRSITKGDPNLKTELPRWLLKRPTPS